MAEFRGYIINSDEKGSINISEDVIAIIAAVATADIEGIHGPFASYSKDISGMLGRKGMPKGVKLCIEGDDITIDISIIVEIGFSVSEVAANVQRTVISAVQDAVGVAVKAVNVSVCGIALKKK